MKKNHLWNSIAWGASYLFAIISFVVYLYALDKAGDTEIMVPGDGEGYDLPTSAIVAAWFAFIGFAIAGIFAIVALVMSVIMLLHQKESVMPGMTIAAGLFSFFGMGFVSMVISIYLVTKE